MSGSMELTAWLGILNHGNVHELIVGRSGWEPNDDGLVLVSDHRKFHELNVSTWWIIWPEWKQTSLDFHH
jgi:hypothetical protein